MSSPSVTPATPYFLLTPRLAFRYWRADDLPLALELWGDPQVSKFLGGPFSPQEISRRLEHEIALMVEYKVQYWPVFLREDDRHVGCAGLRPYKPEEQIFEIGVHLRPAFWRKGFAEEATNAIADYAFNTLGIKGLFAGHHPDNATSRHLLAKHGFTYIGDHLYPPTGELHPSYIRMKP